MTIEGLLIFVGAPSFACFLIGAVLASRRRWLGIRLIGLSFVVVNLLAGAFLLASVFLGGAEWPAALAALMAIGVGLLLLAILRRVWLMPATWQGRA